MTIEEEIAKKIKDPELRAEFLKLSKFGTVFEEEKNIIVTQKNPPTITVFAKC